eukprot:TRINITY_DN3256_c0_g2_i1.p1 TRINITY_DN3256_c0_g2~~TRINITY_DN3256_c0_g2_i1.p1  ORF type:complete len:161 (-),score=22.46 TRINITY_DN3256_c0_g2_i1:66-548(-)
MCNKTCNIVAIVVGTIFTFVGILCFIVGFASSKPDALKINTPFFCLAIFGSINTLFTFGLIFSKGRHKALIHIYTLLNLFTLVFAGAIMFQTAVIVDSLYSNETCKKVAVSDECSQNSAQFVGSLLYAIGQIIVLQAILPLLRDEDESIKDIRYYDSFTS